MKTVLTGVGGAPFTNEIKKCGFSHIILPSDEDLPPFAASHADMITVDLGGKLLFSRSYFEKNKAVTGMLPAVLTDEEHGKEYPRDILFNVLFTDTHLYGNLPFVSKKIKHHAASSNITPVTVKQGYTKCSVAKTARGYITADAGICRALEQNGENVLKIAPGHFVLPGLDFGFIGGASFYADGVLYFFGNINRHPNAEKIKNFCKDTFTEVICLSDCAPIDIGGAVIL